MDDNPTSPITAYRWFQALPGGRLAGARDVIWPPEKPLQARHVGTLVASERLAGRRPLCSALWAALSRAERSGVALVGLGVLVGVGLGAGPVAAGIIAAAAAVLGWQVLRHRQGLADAITRVSAGVLGACAVLAVAGAVWLFVDAGLAGAGGDGGAMWRGSGSGLVCLVMAGAIAGLLVGYFRPPGGTGHACPSLPRRIGARWVSECGIYGYATLALAARAASREWALTTPVVLARVSLWGTVFPYSDGYRAGWARIEALYDDTSGQVEIPAAAYGVAVEPLPGTVTPPAAQGPRRLRHLAAASEGLRAWADQRKEAR